MKRCPECRRDYTDETLNFCLDDGAALVDGPASGNEPATAVFHETAPPGEAATRTQITEPESVYGSAQHNQSVSTSRAAKPLTLLTVAALVVIGGLFS